MLNRIKNTDFRIFLGALLIVGGLLGILEKVGVITNASGFFWAFIFILAGAVFIFIFITKGQHWWSLIPGSALIGLALTVALPEKSNIYSGLAFLGALGVGFFILYLFNHKRWWAIIPSGVLLTLGIISSVSSQVREQDTGAIFFIGLGLTFLSVAILPTGLNRMSWAFIPAIILMIFGALLRTSMRGSLDYVWIGALFICGFFMIWQFFKTQKY